MRVGLSEFRGELRNSADSVPCKVHAKHKVLNTHRWQWTRSGHLGKQNGLESTRVTLNPPN